MTFPAPRAILPNAFAVTRENVTPRYYGLVVDGSDNLQVIVYSLSGEPIEDLAAYPSFAGELPDICIVSDPLGNVGAPTLAWVDAEGGSLITVWDAEADVDYTYSPGGGLVVGGLRYLAGKLYWWEYPTTFTGGTDPTVNLMRANADLTDVEMVGTDDVESGGADNTALDIGSVALNSAAGIAGFVASGGEVESNRVVRITLAAAASQAAGAVEIGAIPDASGTSVGPQRGGTPHVLEAIPDDTSGTAVARWPTSAGWTLDDALNVATTANRVTALFFGTLASAGHAIEAAASATSGSPSFTTDISDHPTHGPIARLFFMT